MWLHTKLPWLASLQLVRLMEVVTISFGRSRGENYLTLCRDDDDDGVVVTKSLISPDFAVADDASSCLARAIWWEALWRSLARALVAAMPPHLHSRKKASPFCRVALAGQGDGHGACFLASTARMLCNLAIPASSSSSSSHTDPEKQPMGWLKYVIWS